MSSIFGGGVSGASQQSQQAQQAANAATQRFIEQRSAEARADILSIFPQAQQLGAQGFQGALDVLGGGIPQQLAAFQQGNIGAQQVTGDTFSQIQNAILGLPVDPSAFAPQNIQTDLSFLSGLTAPGLQIPDQPVIQPPINGAPPGGGLPGISPPIAGLPGGTGIPGDGSSRSAFGGLFDPIASGSQFSANTLARQAADRVRSDFGNAGQIIPEPTSFLPVNRGSVNDLRSIAIPDPQFATPTPTLIAPVIQPSLSNVAIPQIFQQPVAPAPNLLDLISGGRRNLPPQLGQF